MKILILFWIFYVPTALAIISEDSLVPDFPTKNSKIVNGLMAQSCQFPYQVALLKYTTITVNGTTDTVSGQFCGGSLIKPNLVLTAAHCLYGQKARDIKVLVGTKFLSDKGNPAFVYDAAALVVHEDYNPTALSNDLALIWLTDSQWNLFSLSSLNEMNLV